MCGLVGAFGLALTDKEKRIFRDMWMFDIHRGRDSSGVIIANDEGCVWDRDLGLPNHLWEDYYGGEPLFDDRGVAKGKVNLLAGHNRHATVGGVTIDTAHPFCYGDIVGMHNGTLKSQYEKNMPLEGGGSDSQHIFNHLSQHGVQGVWSNLDYQDAAALVWWDMEKETINFIRNYHRPLWFVTHENTLFWASERWMLELAFNIAGEKIGDTMFSSTRFEELPTDRHVSVKLEGSKLKVSTHPVEKKKYVSTYTSLPSMGFKATEKKLEVAPIEVPLLTHRGPKGNLVTKSRLQEYLHSCQLGSACIWCGNPVTVDDHNDLSWIGEKAVLCGGCSDLHPDDMAIVQTLC